MACICSGVSCTQVVVSGITYCDCLVSQDATCPEGSQLINLGDGNIVCRSTEIVDTLPCGTITCDTANGYSYNSITQKCEKTVLSEPCGPGYIFVPTSDGVGSCVPEATGVLLCPEGYTYDSINKRCTKIIINSANETTVEKCQADIVFVNGINATSNFDEKAFVDTFIDSIAADLDSTSYNFRIGVTHCGITSSNNNGDKPYLYSGPNTSPGTSVDPTSVVIKSSYPTPAITSAAQPNTITQGLTRAARALYESNTITASTYLLPRTNVRKIIVLITEHGPGASTTYSVIPSGSCTANNTNDYMGHYPASGSYPWQEMRKAVNQAKCLLAANPTLEIFCVWSGPDGNPIWAGKEPQFFFDIKSAGSVYHINGGGGATAGSQFRDDLFSLVCGITTTYTCPIGQTLVGTNCQGLDVQPAGNCDSTCTIIPSGDNALCQCVLPSVPTLCGSCGIINNQCGCILQEEPNIIESISPISLDDPKYFDKIEWTISYDPKSKMWLSFHDWHPSLLIPSQSHFFTIKDKSFWKHNERFDSFTNYYNVNDTDLTKDYGWEIEYNIVTPNEITTLRSVEYYMEAYKYYNNGKDMFHILDENFDRAIIYNSEQVSPLLNLKIKNKNNPLEQLSYPIAGPINTIILASKEENKYRFNTFYDITKDRQEFLTSAPTIPGFMIPGSGALVPMFITAVDGYHKTINPAYVDVLKKPLEHKKFRHFGNKIVLKKTTSGDKKMLLKLVNSKMLNSPK